MKISLNWLRSYIETNHTAEQLSEILTSTGLEVEGWEVVESVPGGLKGFVTAHVLTCTRFEVKDKQLSLCSVDTGDGTPKQVVCGAANVDAGQKVILATVGTQLYNADGSPLFQISAKKTYGEMSEGMICAEDELGLGTSHDGIMVLPQDTPIGIPAAEYFKLENDTLIEIGLTPNRSDATNHLGVAADLAAYFRANENWNGQIQRPEVPEASAYAGKCPVEVIVENTAACARYAGLVIKGVKIGESPDWLKNRLSCIGVRSINNVVDITNYVLHECGQPLHAFDLKAVAGQQVRVKCLPQGTKFVTLDGTARELHAEDLMICDGNSAPMCIAGVFGGAESGVSENTTDIFLESAHFAATVIRRTSTRHLLRTDAATRFEKGTDPNGTVWALLRAAKLIEEIAGGKIEGGVTDHYPNPVARPQVHLRYTRVNTLIGQVLSPERVKAILEAMDMGIADETPESITVSVPTNKVDVLREADVIEEIIRIHGLNQVPFPDGLRSSLSYSPKPNPYKLRNVAADYLSALGFSECMALSLTQSKYAREVLPFAEEQCVYVHNTANSHLDLLRPTMLFGLLEAAAHNQNRQNPDLKLCEFGATYHKTADGAYQEQAHCALLITGRRQAENWHATGKNGVTFYTLKTTVDNLLNRLGISGYRTEVLEPGHAMYDYGVKLSRGKQVIGEFGLVKKAILKKMDIRQDAYFADFQWATVLEMVASAKLTFKELPKFPAVRRDFALVLDKDKLFASIEEIAKKQGKPLLKEVGLFDVYEGEKIGEGKKSYAISLTFQDEQKTLTEQEIDKAFQAIMDGCEQQLGAQVRRG